jgi:3-hydroxybutyryl-CoA dehydrogenase
MPGVRSSYEFAKIQLGKTIFTAKDRAGFVVNALLIPYLLSAIRMVDVGLASAAAVAVSMYEETREQLYAPPALLLRKVEAGDLGRKTGRGFFTYR